MMFYDAWLWLIFICLGLVMVLLELLVGVDTGLDMVFLGSAFIIGGLATWPAYNWVLTLVITCVICVAYVGLGRRYVHRWRATKKEKTNIDTIIGKKGRVLQSIVPNDHGLVKVGNEEWRARAAERIEKGEEIEVTDVQGVTLTVIKNKGGA
jgi:membrane protein implicated in regulation of membrane protease activity